MNSCDLIISYHVEFEDTLFSILTSRDPLQATSNPLGLPLSPNDLAFFFDMTMISIIQILTILIEILTCQFKNKQHECIRI
jgi:hypothetical protein